MSKASALEMATGIAPTQVNPSLHTGEATTGLSPGLSEAPPIATEAKAPTETEEQRFERFAQRETKLQQERELAKKELAEARAEKEKVRHINEQVQRFTELKAKDPIAAFKELGFTETDFVNWAAEQNKELTPEEKMAKVAEQTASEKLEAYKKEQAEKEAKVEQERDQRVVSGFKQNIGKFILENSEKYEAITYQGEPAQEIIYQAVLDEIKKNPNGEKDPYTIAKEVTEIYEEYLSEDFLEMAKLKKHQDKIKALVTPAEPPKEVKAKHERVRTLDQPPQKKIPSLSNATTATVASVATQKKETPSEKRERLINALRNGTAP